MNRYQPSHIQAKVEALECGCVAVEMPQQAEIPARGRGDCDGIKHRARARDNT